MSFFTVFKIRKQDKRGFKLMEVLEDGLRFAPFRISITSNENYSSTAEMKSRFPSDKPVNLNITVLGALIYMNYALGKCTSFWRKINKSYEIHIWYRLIIKIVMKTIHRENKFI